MEKRKITLLTTACIILFFFSFYLLNKNKKTDRVQSNLTNLVSDLQIKQDFYYHNFKIGSEMNGLYAPDITCLENHHEKKISELGQGKPILICLYKIECSACDKNELKELQDAFKDTPESAYILCSHLIKRELYVYARKNQVKIPILGIAADLFNWIAENYDKPYYFVLHPNLKISHVYFPSKDYIELNKHYLEGVKRFLSD